MRVLSRIAGIHILTAALLTWVLLALGWSELFDLPGFETNKAPAPVVVSSRPEVVEAVPKSAMPRAAEPQPRAPAQTQPPGQPMAERAPIVTATAPPPVPAHPAPPPPPAREPPPPAVVVIPPPPPPQVAVPPPIQQPLPSANPHPAATVPPLPRAAIVIPAPTAPNAAVTPPPAAPQAITPTAPQRVVEAAPIVVPPPAPPRVALDTRPVVSPPPPSAAAPVQRTQPAPPSQTTRMWQPVRRVAGYGADMLLDQLDDPRRAADDLPCIVFERIRFRAGTSSPLPGAAREIGLLSTSLRAVPGGIVEIGSRIGTTRMTPANQRLAIERARYVRDQLSARGVTADRMSLDNRTAYHNLIGDDLGRMGLARAPSIGVCVLRVTS